MQICASHKNCIEEAMNKAAIICQDRGLRFTDLRKKVLKMIWQNHEPTKAYDIIGKIKEGKGAAKPPTVYRTLDFLQENGLIHKLESMNAYIGCEHPLGHKECYFLICRKCNEIKECCNISFSNEIKNITKKNKFKAKRISLEIYGECKECR